MTAPRICPNTSLLCTRCDTTCNGADPVRDCICADPENCTESVPGYRCRKAHGDGVKAARAAFGVPSEERQP